MTNDTIQEKTGWTAKRQKDGRPIWFSVESTTTPKGRLSFGSVYKASNTQFDAEGDEPMFRCEVRWDNEDAATSQPRYKQFHEDCLAFIKACQEQGADVKVEDISLPFMAKTRKAKEEGQAPIPYWAIRTKSKSKTADGKRIQPTLKAITNEGEIVIDRDQVADISNPEYLYDGCEAAIRGPLMLCNTAGNWFLRVQLRTVYHVGDGERYEGDPGPAPDLGEFGVQAEPVAAAEGGF